NCLTAVRAFTVLETMQKKTHHGCVVSPSLCRDTEIVVTPKKANPFPCFVSPGETDQFGSQPRDAQPQPAALVRNNVDQPIAPLFCAIRKAHDKSWKQTACILRFHDPLHSNGHGSGAMRD